MIQTRFILIMLSFGLVACGSSETTNNSSPLVGTWQTTECLLTPAPNKVPFYNKGLYVFTSQGTILSGKKVYSDIGCTTLERIVTPTDSKFANGTTFTTQYSDGGKTTLQDGTAGFGLNIGFTNGTDDQRLSSSDGFYSTTTNLCFSEAFVFTTKEFNIKPNAAADIDYINCLTADK